jgi:hypothetical protein
LAHFFLSKPAQQEAGGQHPMVPEAYMSSNSGIASVRFFGA